ncbi:MAG: metalloregulator ArsR/SmtB family transcription factor [Nitrospirae bacterium]|nr:metalloregulator ArsR/SmtB family transcription factor [Nitrospirota bacterium]
MQELLNVFKALSDETRLRILKIAEKGEICVCDLVSVLDMSQPKISFHLNTLKEAGLLKDRKQGKWVHYSINDSDMFRRFLVLSVLEKIPGEAVKKNLARLRTVMNIKNKNRCCEK